MKISLLLFLLNVRTIRTQACAGNGASLALSEEDALGLVQVRLQMQQHQDVSHIQDDLKNAFSRDKLSEISSSNPPVSELDLDFHFNNEEDPDDLREWLPLAQPEQLNPESCQHELLPSLLYIGLNHAGSTTVAEILNKLPGWSYGEVKEHRFFADTGGVYLNNMEWKKLNKTHQCTREARNLEAYKKEFTVGCGVNLTFDASPFYWVLGNGQLKDKKCLIPGSNGSATKSVFLAPPGQKSLSNIRDILGDTVKIIFAVKDPVDWLSSMRSVGDPEAESLICMADALESWLSVFPRKNFLFLDSKTMFEDLPRTINSIVDFAGMPKPKMRLPTASEFSPGRRRNTQAISEEYRRSFHASFHSCKMRLENLTGLSFNWTGSL